MSNLKIRLNRLEEKHPEKEPMILFIKTPEQKAEIENADLEKLYPSKRVILFVRDGGSENNIHSLDVTR